jgi:hypothetical protein
MEVNHGARDYWNRRYGVASGGCGSNMPAPATTNPIVSKEQQCMRGGGWWRQSLGICDMQGTGVEGRGRQLELSSKLDPARNRPKGMSRPLEAARSYFLSEPGLRGPQPFTRPLFRDVSRDAARASRVGKNAGRSTNETPRAELVGSCESRHVSRCPTPLQ